MYGNGLDHVVLGELTTTTGFWAQIEPVLRAKVAELFETDWADARARVGVDACGDDLLRSEFDAVTPNVGMTPWSS